MSRGVEGKPEQNIITESKEREYFKERVINYINCC